MSTEKTPEQDAQEIKNEIRDLQDALTANMYDLKYLEGFSAALAMNREKIMKFSNDAAECWYDKVKFIPMIGVLTNWAINQMEPLENDFSAIRADREKLYDQLEELNKILIDLGGRPTYKTENERRAAKLAAQKRWRENRRVNFWENCSTPYAGNVYTLSPDEYQERGEGAPLRILVGSQPGPEGQVFVVESAQFAYVENRPELVRRVFAADLVQVKPAGPQPG